MFNIMNKKWIFLGISIALIVISLGSIIFQGFNLDTDFAGGMALTYEIKGDFTTEEVEKLASEALGADRRPSSVQKSEGSDVVIKFGYDNNLSSEEERSAYAIEKINAITAALEEKYGAPVTQEGTNVLESGVVKKSEDVVSPSTGRELARSAMWMSILAAIAILVYVTFRFEFTSGVAAVIGLVHDVVILIGVYSVLRLSVDTSFIAAILTVLGYSINNTIVIFDRIRENTKRAKKQTYAEIANTSIVQTLTRSINTTITTLLTIVLVYILGVTSIKAFALPIIIGIVIGTYSSIFVTGPIWAIWKDAGVSAKKKAKAA